MIDAVIHGNLTKHFANLLYAGEVYPRFAYEMFGGYGNYVFFFYPPLTLYLNSIFTFLATDHNLYFEALRLSISLAVMVSALLSYLWLKREFGEKAALVGALFYISYPALSATIFLSFSMGMIWCYAWYPLAMIGASKIIAGEQKGSFIYALALGLILLTNIPAVIIFAPFSALYIFLFQPRLRTGMKLIFAGALALGLAAIYLIPQLAYLKYVNSELLWQQDFYPLTLLGLNYLLFALKNGYRDLLLTFSIFIYICGQLIYLKIVLGKKKSLLPFTLAAVALILTSSLARPIWDNFSLLQKLQYASRFFLVAQVFATLLTAKLIATKPVFTKQIIAFFILPQVILAYSLFYVAPTVSDAARKLYDQSFIAYEYTVKSETMDEAIRSLTNPQVEDFTIVSGGGTAKPVLRQSRRIELIITTEKNLTFEIGRSYFPGWTASLNGENLPVFKDEFNGLMEIKTGSPVKDGRLIVTLPLLLEEKIGTVLSAVSLVILAVGLLRRQRIK